MSRKKTIKLTVSKIHEVWMKDETWWARVDAAGPLGTYSVLLGFHNEEDARGCVGVSFKKQIAGG